MNDQEKALHIGEILTEWTHDKKTIYTYPDREPIFCIGLRSPGTIQLLFAHPERFGIKKEPRIIFVNILQHPNPGRSEYPILYNSSASAEQNAACSVDTVLVTAHPIELPEVT